FGLKLHLIGTTPIDHLDPSWRTLDETRLGELRSRIMIEARGTGQTPSEAWARISKAIDIDRNLQTFADAGIPPTYHACDAGDREALARVLAQVRAKDGPIDGILHGAAIEQSCRYEKKNRQGVMATFGSKVLGAYNLMDLTRQDPITHFVGFGSISGRMGDNGQTDYAAASDMLCKLTGWYRRQKPGC